MNSNDIQQVYSDLSKELKEKYGSVLGTETGTLDFNRRKEMVACQLLIEQMESMDAPQNELYDVLKYMIVVTDADKYNMNWRQAYDDFQIDNYISKYVEENNND